MNLVKYRLFRLFLLPLFLLCASTGIFAQQNSEIVGTVTDAQGAVIPGAQVTLTQAGTGFTSTTQSNASGYFSFPGLNLGTYDLKVAAKGFQTSVSKGLTLNISQVLRSDTHMAVGADTQTVTVTANALTVQTDSNVVSTLISSDQITQLATENRNFAALAALGLGVSSSLPSNNTPTSIASNFTISVNGLRESHNIWLIDGGEADDRGAGGGMDVMPSQDAIAQFEMLTSNYPPDYGISSGATISLGLKSGTKQFHGELWEFNRNTAYDANNYFNKQATPVQPRQVLKYNIFGFNIGGPIFIPKAYNTDKQKTFFFWNEEWRRLVQASSPTQAATLPLADFPVAGQPLAYQAPAFAQNTALVVPKVGDPAFNAKLASLGLIPGQKFPNNTIPASLFDPNAVLYLNSGVVPKPNTTTGYNLGTAVQPINVRDDIVRIDHRINDKWQLLGHYMHDSVTQAYAQPMLGWSGASYNTITSTLSNPSNSAAVKLTGSITPNLLVEVSMNYDGNVLNITNNGDTLPGGWSVNKYFNNGAKDVPNMHFGAPYNTQENPGSAPWHNAAEDYEPKLDVSYIMGKHSMKFGLSYNRYTKNQQLFGNPNGNFTFGNLTGDSMMDVLLGITSNYDQAQSLPTNHYVNQTPSAYAMDNWHVTPRLSLQLGLRYDALPHAWERANRLANFDPNQYLSSLAPTYIGSALDPTGPGFITPAGASRPFYMNGIGIAGQNGVPVGLVNNDYKTLQPRIGFSEDLFGDGKTVLRGGFGTFFERLQGNDIYNAATTVPFFNDPSATSVYFSDPHTTWVNGQTAANPFFAQGMTTLAKTYPAPAVAMFSLGLQREIAPSVVYVIQYVGNLAWHQNIERQINNYPLNTPLSIRANAGDPSNHSGTNPTGTNLFNSDQYRTYQGYTNINQQENTTNGNYNGFQTGLRVQNRWGLSGELDYTWSHEIDVTSYDLNGVSNPFNLKYDKGSGALDRRQILSANYIYQLPIFREAGGLSHAVLGGWEVAGTAIFESGPIIQNQGPNLSVGYDTIGLGGGYTNRPNVTGKMKYPKKAKEWFNTSQYSTPLPVWAGGPNQGFGNAGRDSAVGPGRVDFTTSLYKSFAITEGIHFEMRLESFNTFNHTEFNNVGATYQGLNSSGVPAGNFGQITSTWDPRVLSLGATFTFKLHPQFSTQTHGAAATPCRAFSFAYAVVWLPSAYPDE